MCSYWTNSWGVWESCHKRCGETGNFLICFCQTEMKYTYYLIGVLELHAVLFYSFSHVNPSDSYVTEGNDPFPLAWVSFEGWKNSVDVIKWPELHLKGLFSDESGCMWRSWFGSASGVAPRRAAQKTSKGKNSPLTSTVQLPLWNSIIYFHSDHLVVYVLSVLLAVCQWI